MPSITSEQRAGGCLPAGGRLMRRDECSLGVCISCASVQLDVVCEGLGRSGLEGWSGG